MKQGGAFTKKTIRDVALDGKTVLVRADYNVPLQADGTIADDYRIRQNLPTIQYLLDHNCKVIICSHMGRPQGKPVAHLSLRPVARHLQRLLGKKVPVSFAEDCVGHQAENAAQGLHSGQVLLLENLRFHPQEEANDPEFAASLAKLAQLFVQDGFGVVHRAHASTEAITHFLPSVAGLLLEKEVKTLVGATSEPQRPLMTIVGGAKIADKLDVLERFIAIADFVAVGGAMANTFLKAQRVDIGKSVADAKEIPIAKDVLELAAGKAKKQPFIFYLPQDGVVARSLSKQSATRIVDWQENVVADIEAYPKRPALKSHRVASDEMILDIGPTSGSFIAGAMQLTQTVIWNGTMGVTEVSAVSGAGPVGPFAHGTEAIVAAMLGGQGHRPFSIVGGGDTVSYVESRGLTDSFNHVSTGGGASLELMSGKKLPGVEALQKK